MDDGDAPGLPIADSPPARLRALEAKERPHVDAERGPAERLIPGEQVAQAVREAEDPLPDGHPGQHLIHEVGGALGHAPAPQLGQKPRVELETTLADQTPMTAPPGPPLHRQIETLRAKLARA